MSTEVGRDWVVGDYELQLAGAWDLQGVVRYFYGYSAVNWCFGKLWKLADDVWLGREPMENRVHV